MGRCHHLEALRLVADLVFAITQLGDLAIFAAQDYLTSDVLFMGNRPSQLPLVLSLPHPLS